MTRWIKVYRDLWINRSRTVLVILSIVVGVFAIGMIAATRQALKTSLNVQYTAIQPADAIFQTDPVLNDDFVAGIRNMRGVDEAEGRRALPMRISLDGQGETWRDITLYALADYDDQHVFLIHPQSGIWPPEKKQVLMERASMDYIGLQPGQQILVKTTDGRKFHLTVTGSVHDQYRIPPVIEGWIYGYVSEDTIRWMGESEDYNELYVRVSNPAQILALSKKINDRIEGLELPVYQKTLPKPGEHPLGYLIDTVLLLLGLVAALAMLLSVFLVINVISALIVQQERQIGIMQAIGARSWQITNMYFGMVIILGLIACMIAIPPSVLAAEVLAAFVAEMLNFNPPAIQLTLQTLLLQFGVGLLVPLLAATPAILSGTQVSPARVLSEYGISQVWSGAGIFDRILHSFPRIPRDTLLAFRNPFRKRGRLFLSLVTLTIAGAVFMAIINLNSSLTASLNKMFDFWRYDAWLIVNDYFPAARLVDEANTVPGVVQAEAWGFTIGRYIRPDDTESGNLYLLAPPAGTPLLNPPIIAGRSLLPGDTAAILVSPGFLANEPTLHLGSPMKVKIDGREQTYTIVGIMNMMGNSTIGFFTVMDYTAFTRHVREPNRANAIILTMVPRDLETQRLLSSQIEQHYDHSNIKVLSNFIIAEEREEIEGVFAIIVALLMIMAILLATVGGLGMMGTMSLNIIERIREIGVMRAYGASNIAIFRIVIVEGLLIGVLSWILAIGLSLPISVLLARNIGEALMDTPMNASYSPGGVLAWLGLVVVISIVASLFPALRAVRLTVTEVLAYE